MALALRILSDARTLLSKVLAELQLDGEDVTELSGLTLTEGSLTNVSAWLDKLEARLVPDARWDDQWAAAQDEVWERITATLPSFANLLEDDRTRVLAKRIMRLAALRRCQTKVG